MIMKRSRVSVPNGEMLPVLTSEGASACDGSNFDMVGHWISLTRPQPACSNTRARVAKGNMSGCHAHCVNLFRGG